MAARKCVLVLGLKYLYRFCDQPKMRTSRTPTSRTTTHRWTLIWPFERKDAVDGLATTHGTTICSARAAFAAIFGSRVPRARTRTLLFVISFHFLFYNQFEPHADTFAEKILQVDCPSVDSRPAPLSLKFKQTNIGVATSPRECVSPRLVIGVVIATIVRS